MTIIEELDAATTTAKARGLSGKVQTLLAASHKTQAPTIPVGLLGTPGRANLPALATWADQINPSHHSVDSAYVDRVHRLGMECLVWTVNRGAGMERALRLGVDGIITNRPDVLGRALRARLDAPARGVHAANGRHC